MQTFAVLSITLWLAPCVLAQKPHPCRSPPLLVGSLIVSTQTGDFVAFSKYSYDALGNRVRFQESGSHNNKSFHVDKLMLFRKRVMYDISYHNRTCVKRRLNVPFHPMEVPRQAQLLGQVILGSSSAPGQGLLVNTWTGEVPQTEGKYFATYTEFGCLPVSSLYYSNKTGWITASFFNNVLGIENPQVFFPPDFCNSQDKSSNEEIVTDFFDALF